MKCLKPLTIKNASDLKELENLTPSVNDIRSDELKCILYGKPRGTIFRDDIFKDSLNRRQRRAKQAFDTKEKKGWAVKLFEVLDEPYFYTLLPNTHLGFNKEYRNAFYIFRALPIAQMKLRVKELLNEPFYYKFEVGESGSLHIHLIANKEAGLSEISRNGRVIKEVSNKVGLVEYLSKPRLSYSPTMEVLLKREKYRLRKQGQKRFSKTSGTYGLRKQ